MSARCVQVGNKEVQQNNQVHQSSNQTASTDTAPATEGVAILGHSSYCVSRRQAVCHTRIHVFGGAQSADELPSVDADVFGGISEPCCDLPLTNGP